MPLGGLVTAGALAIGAGAIGGGGAALGKVGKNTNKPGNFAQSGYYDPNRFEYGGQAGMGQQQAAYNRAIESQYQTKANDLYNQTAGDLAAQNEQRGLALQARGQQQEAANLMINRARGRDLVANQVGAANRAALASQIHSQQMGARGPAALANSQSDAMAALGQGTAGINRDQAIAAMQEQQAAEQGAANAFGNLQQGDLAARQQDLALRGQNISGAQAMGGLGVQYGQLGQGVYNQMNQLNLAQQGTLSGSAQQQTAIQQQINQANADNERKNLEMVVGGVTGGAGMGAKGFAPTGKADGGPLSKDKGEIVGEHGPEIFIPKKDGYIVPNPKDQPSVFYGPDGRPYAMSEAGPVPLQAKPREMTGFSRDTPVQQKAVGEKYYADLGKQADALIAQLNAAKQTGPSIARDEGEIDEAPPGWLADYMQSQQAPQGLQIAQRQYGGDVQGGMPYLVGEGGMNAFGSQGGMDHREEGGPVTKGKPTVVGEKGPEKAVGVSFKRPEDEQGKAELNKLFSELQGPQAEVAQDEEEPEPAPYVAPSIPGSLPPPRPPPVSGFAPATPAPSPVAARAMHQQANAQAAAHSIGIKERLASLEAELARLRGRK